MYSAIAANKRNTVIIIAVFLVIIGGLGALAAWIIGDWSIAIVVFVSLCGAVWTLWERAQHDPWLALLAAVRRRLAQSGLEVAAISAPRQIAQSVQQRWGEQSADLQAWLLRLEALRYARQPAYSLAQLRREFKSITWPA